VRLRGHRWRPAVRARRRRRPAGTRPGHLPGRVGPAPGRSQQPPHRTGPGLIDPEQPDPARRQAGQAGQAGQARGLHHQRVVHRPPLHPVLPGDVSRGARRDRHGVLELLPQPASQPLAHPDLPAGLTERPPPTGPLPAGPPALVPPPPQRRHRGPRSHPSRRSPEPGCGATVESAASGGARSEILDLDAEGVREGGSQAHQLQLTDGRAPEPIDVIELEDSRATQVYPLQGRPAER